MTTLRRILQLSKEETHSSQLNGEEERRSRERTRSNSFGSNISQSEEKNINLERKPYTGKKRGRKKKSEILAQQAAESEARARRKLYEQEISATVLKSNSNLSSLEQNNSLMKNDPALIIGRVSQGEFGTGHYTITQLPGNSQQIIGPNGEIMIKKKRGRPRKNPLPINHTVSYPVTAIINGVIPSLSIANGHSGSVQTLSGKSRSSSSFNLIENVNFNTSNQKKRSSRSRERDYDSGEEADEDDHDQFDGEHQDFELRDSKRYKYREQDADLNGKEKHSVSSSTGSPSASPPSINGTIKKGIYDQVNVEDDTTLKIKVKEANSSALNGHRANRSQSLSPASVNKRSRKVVEDSEDESDVSRDDFDDHDNIGSNTDQDPIQRNSVNNMLKSAEKMRPEKYPDQIMGQESPVPSPSNSNRLKFLAEPESQREVKLMISNSISPRGRKMVMKKMHSAEISSAGINDPEDDMEEDVEEEDDDVKNWVACDRCKKWFELPLSVNHSSLPKEWFCEMITWNTLSHEQNKQNCLQSIASPHARDPNLPANASAENWVACDACKKWRKLPLAVDVSKLPLKWFCYMNLYDPLRNDCSFPQQAYSDSDYAYQKSRRIPSTHSLHSNTASGESDIEDNDGDLDIQNGSGKRKMMNNKMKIRRMKNLRTESSSASLGSTIGVGPSLTGTEGAYNTNKLIKAKFRIHREEQEHAGMPTLAVYGVEERMLKKNKRNPQTFKELIWWHMNNFSSEEYHAAQTQMMKRIYTNSSLVSNLEDQIGPTKNDRKSTFHRLFIEPQLLISSPSISLVSDLKSAAYDTISNYAKLNALNFISQSDVSIVEKIKSKARLFDDNLSIDTEKKEAYLITTTENDKSMKTEDVI